MNGNNSTSNEVQRLKTILDAFPVGAVKIENVLFPGKVNDHLQSVNLLRSKLRYLNIIENLTDSIDKTDNVERKSIHTDCIDSISCIIAEDKAVDAGTVAECLNDIVQRPDGDELKQKVLKQLGDIQDLALEFNELSSNLTELKSTRMNLEVSQREQLETTGEFVNDVKNSGRQSEVPIKLEISVEKINKMGRLINAFLLGPGAELQDKWLDVFYSVRDCVNIDELL